VDREALGRIIQQTESHNRLLQCEDMWALHRKQSEQQGETADKSGVNDVSHSAASSQTRGAGKPSSPGLRTPALPSVTCTESKSPEFSGSSIAKAARGSSTMACSAKALSVFEDGESDSARTETAAPVHSTESLNKAREEAARRRVEAYLASDHGAAQQESLQGDGRARSVLESEDRERRKKSKRKSKKSDFKAEKKRAKKRKKKHRSESKEERRQRRAAKPAKRRCVEACMSSAQSDQPVEESDSSSDSRSHKKDLSEDSDLNKLGCDWDEIDDLLE